jgi:hypothetical protein
VYIGSQISKKIWRQPDLLSEIWLKRNKGTTDQTPPDLVELKINARGSSVEVIYPTKTGRPPHEDLASNARGSSREVIYPTKTGRPP